MLWSELEPAVEIVSSAPVHLSAPIATLHISQSMVHVYAMLLMDSVFLLELVVLPIVLKANTTTKQLKVA